LPDARVSASKAGATPERGNATSVSGMPRPWIELGGKANPGEVVVPEDLWRHRVPGHVVLRYGSLEAPARLRLEGGFREETRSATVHRVHAGPDLQERLALRPEPLYQLRTADGRIEIGPVLGLMLPERNQAYLTADLRSRTGRVVEAYLRSGGLYCAFAAGDVSPVDRCVHGLFYDPGRRKWVPGRFPVPPVVYRRSFLQPQPLVERIREMPGVRVFNSRRFDKWELYEIFRRDWILRRYLPETVLAADGAEVRALAARYGGAVLKPRDLSRGRGVLFLEPEGDCYRLVRHLLRGAPVRQPFTAAKLDLEVAGRLAGRGYLCQRRLRLAEINGKPFDVRVVMQRTSTGRWRCTGIECRLAGPERLLTNISAGGDALWLTGAVERAFEGAVEPARVERKLRALGLRVCAALDSTGQDFAELGLDFALDRKGRVWLIEANVLPTFYGFRALDRNLHRALLLAPLSYGCRLAGFRMLPGGEGVPAADRASRSGSPAPPRTPVVHVVQASNLALPGPRAR